ncbi:MAG: hypothetical protein JXQ66_01130 [Campylobacterales bacterium]|nr:hypothetical protein [Campylobacterales bacterium]
MKYLFLILITSSLFTSLNAQNISLLSKKLNLYAGTKAIVQWERIFSSQRHLKRYKLDELPEETRDELKKYLIAYAIDSDKPIVPGL